MRSRLYAATAALALLLSMPAGAEEESWGGRFDIDWFGPVDPENDILLCIFLPYATCQHTIDSAIGYGGGRGWGVELQWEEPNDYTQLYIDLTYLVRVTGRPSFQIGPSVGFEIEIFDESRRYHIFAAAHGRLWAGSWVTAELALGVVGSFDGDWSYTGVGGLGELALTLHCHLGLYVNTQVVAGPDGVETRVTGGFRGSLITWLSIFGAMGG